MKQDKDNYPPGYEPFPGSSGSEYKYPSSDDKKNFDPARAYGYPSTEDRGGSFIGADAPYVAAHNEKKNPTATPPPTRIEDMTTREFLHHMARNKNTPSSKRKTFASLITMSDENYQAFIDIVALHLMDTKSDFMFNVIRSASKEIQLAQASSILDLLAAVGV